jgi:hypothetical protein
VKQEVTRKENIVVVLVLSAKQHCNQTKVLDDEHASSMMSIVSSAGKRQLCSAKQISEARGSTIRRPMPRLISSTTKRCSRLRRLDECEQLAADRHAARNSGRQTRRAAEPDSGLDAIEQKQKVALVAARVRHAPRQRLVAQIGLRSVRESATTAVSKSAQQWSHSSMSMR